MARGRAFDSNASGSGSRGGRGPARNARGRGGSIPPSSSGTSGASSYARRPVLPPSLPSAPSSSTPVSGPIQSPPAAQSPTVQEAVRSSSACLRRYERAGKRLGRILHSRESGRYLHKTGAVRLAVMEQDLLDTQAGQYLR
ncbi:hypothetical protein JCGZ_03247 [Jatropha curcas]|uniref:Uncharacterized protein n=1 Tax=Jatropha curcas TaxID=180498 RepID=A0A067KY76_JATCU|nr:hypothetical protein JCGZ_03247 [Jatropha curcas]